MTKAPPVNIEAELSTLGAMMVDKTALDTGLELLSAGDFYRPANAAIFEALANLSNRNEPTDILTLFDELKRIKKVDEVGTDDYEARRYITSIVEVIPCVENIEAYANIVLENSQLRQLIAAGQKIIANAYESSESASAQMANAQSIITGVAVNDRDGLVHIKDMLVPHMLKLEENSLREGLLGYTTGFSHIDVRSGGYGQPMLVLFKARRGQGKTHHMIAASVNCLITGKAAVIFSLDTPVQLMINRYMAHYCGVNAFRLNKPYTKELKDALADASAWFWNQPLYMYCKAGVTVSQIRSKCRALKSQGVDIGFIGIDFAEKMRPERRNNNREQELNDISVDLTLLRDELETTIFLLSQVNKQGGERWSEALGNNSDMILQWQQDEESKDSGMLWTEKTRFGIDTSFECVYDFGTSRIREVDLDFSDDTYPPEWPWWYIPNDEAEYHSVFGDEE